MRTFSDIIADFADAAASHTTNRLKLREMFNRLLFDAAPVVSSAAERDGFYPTPTGDEKVYNKATDSIERYDAGLGKYVVQRRRAHICGTELPNPGFVRFYGLPTVMASPPTVTQGTANAASTITSAVFTAATVDSGGGVYIKNPAAPWRYMGANAVVKAQTFPDELFVTPKNVPSVGVQTGNMAIEFEFDGSVFDFQIKGVGNGQWYRILVDGQYANGLYGQAGPTADGSGYLIKVDFGSRVNRFIRIEFSASGHLGGINVGPNDTMWSSPMPVGPKVVVMGDSFSEGVAGNSSLSSWWDMMGKVLGWRDVQSTALGGTGYLNPGAFTKFRSRVAADVIAFNPDIIVVAGGINDTSYGPALVAGAEQTEATALFAQIRTALPKVKLIVLGPFWPNGSPTADVLTIRDALKAACLADTGSHLFIENIGTTVAGVYIPGWITGTGHVGATAGDGNADLYISSDGTHPTQTGQVYLGRRAAASIALGMPF